MSSWLGSCMIRAVLFCIAKIPYRCILPLSKAVALCLKNSKTAGYAKLNIDIALPDYSEQQRNQIHQIALQNEIASYFEFFKIWGNTTEQNLKQIAHIDGEHYFHTALQKQQGVILIVPHFGTWEIMNSWISQFTSMTIMYKPIKNHALNQYVLQARSRERANLVPTNETGVKQVFRCLKQGGVIAILPDHSPDYQQGEMNTWFGVPLYSSQLTAKLLQKTDATALLLYAVRNEQGKFNMTIRPLFQDCEKQQKTTQKLHHDLEQFITQQPIHYHWSYKRFKANPNTGYIYTLSHQDALNLIKQNKIT